VRNLSSLTNTLLLFLFFILCSSLTNCGGGASSPGVPQSPTFSISLSQSNVILSQGGAAQEIQVSVTGQNGFGSPVSVSASGLPSGVSMSPFSISVTPGTPGTLSFAASGNAGIQQTATTISGVSGALTKSAPLQINVNGAIVADPFHFIGGELRHGYYDEQRQLLFAANPELNEIDVISGLDFSVRARVPAPQPWGIDQMADGNTLVIGTNAQQIVTLDETTLALTSHPVPLLGGPSIGGLFYPNVVAMASGKVLIIGQVQGEDSANILEAGQYVVVWDSTNNGFQIFPYGTDRLVRSADHKWAMLSGNPLYLYSSDADTFTTVPVGTAANFVVGYALNSDGSKIAVFTGQQIMFMDASFNVLGTAPVPSSMQSGLGTAAMFTPDNSELLIQYIPLAFEVIDAVTYSDLGYLDGEVVPGDFNQNNERLMAVDSAGRAFLGVAGGVRVVDLHGAIIPNSTQGNLAGTWCPLPTTVAIPTATTKQLPLAAPPPYPGTSYYFGGQPAALLANGTQINVPASSVAGPVDIECIGSDGNTLMYGREFSYGDEPIGVSANLLPPSGNTSVYVFGYGFSNTPAFSIGGQSVPTIAVSSPTVALQLAQIQIPNGNSGGSVSVKVSSSNGSGTLPQAMSYIPSVSIIPASGLLQVLYDPHRSLLYALKATELDVFNPATLQWQLSVPLPNGVNYNVMALSPDGSRLAIASPAGYVAVIDPSNPSPVSSVSTTSVPGFQSGSIAISKYNRAVLTGSPNISVDLLTLKITSVPGNIGNLVRASADGTHLYGVDLNVSSGQTYSIDPLAYSVQAPPQFGYLFWSDLAVSSDGSKVAAIYGVPYATGDIVGFYDSALNLLDFNVYPLVSPPDDTQVLGSTFSPGGKVVIVPLGDSIEFWDTATGTLRSRLMTPEKLSVFSYPEGPVAPQVTLDAVGQTIFAISASGLSILKLPVPVDNIPANSWARFSAPMNNRFQFSGDIPARLAAMRGKQSR